MRGVNQHTVLGTLGRDPEVTYMPSGDAVCSFSLAVNEQWKDKQTGEQKENVEWIRCTAFRRAAEVIGEYCKKGDALYIQGRQRTRKWEDKETGKDRYSTETMVDTFQLIGRVGKSEGGAANQQRAEQHQNSAPPSQTGSGADFDDDIPF